MEDQEPYATTEPGTGGAKMHDDYRRWTALQMTLDLVKNGKIMPDEYSITRMAKAFFDFIDGKG